MADPQPGATFLPQVLLHYYSVGGLGGMDLGRHEEGREKGRRSRWRRKRRRVFYGSSWCTRLGEKGRRMDEE